MGEQDQRSGWAITSSIHPDAQTHIGPCRYGKGSNSMGLLTTVMTDGGGRLPRWARWLAQVARHPGRLASICLGGRWSERALIGLVMQTPRQLHHGVPGTEPVGPVRADLRQGHGRPNPTWIPAANDAMRRVAAHIDGFPASSLGEIVDIRMPAHFLGGCAIGDSPDSGVIDPYHRLFGHRGLHVIDGSAISANLGVNPSLTITAHAERAAGMWPNRGDEDRVRRWAPPTDPSRRCRRPVPAVPPARPAVPPGTAAALRLPLVTIRHGPAGDHLLG